MADGMVAMVTGLQDCGLALALMGADGKAYALVPNAVGPCRAQFFDAGAQVNGARYGGYGGGARNYNTNTASQGVGTAPPHCDSCAQATEGRFASVYQTQHCNIAPSPPVLYTEFPPQRSEIRPGHGSFQVGGSGSGETSFIPAKSTSYRGGMSWTDRGSVCSPRRSHDTSAFANSLRKYPPSSSPERSLEHIERLVNYSQGRNFPRSPQRSHSPPSRSYDILTPPSYPGSLQGSRQGLYEAERRQRASEDSPTRDRRWQEPESYTKTYFDNTRDARYMVDVSRRLRESIKSMCNYPNLPAALDICKNLAPEMCESNNGSVDIATQVACDVFSPTVAVATVATPTRSIRSVAVPLSTIPSSGLSDQKVTEEANHACSHPVPPSTQPLLTVSSQKSVQTSPSSVVPSETNGNLSKNSKSSSGCRIDEGLKDEILKWLEDNTDPKLKQLQDTVMKKLSKRYKIMSESNSEKLSVKSEDKDDRDNDDIKIIDGIIDKLIRFHFRYCEVDPSEIIKATRSDQSFEQASKILIKEISLNKHDSSRTLKREQVYDAFAHKIKQWSFKKSKANRKQCFRTELLNLLRDAPIDFHGLNKIVYLNTLAEAFVTKLNGAPVEHKNTMNRCEEDPDPSRCLCEGQKIPCQPTIKQLKILVADSLSEFINKINVELNLENVQEIIKILLNAILRQNFSDEIFATEIGTLVKDVTMVPDNEATKFATPCTGQMKTIFNGNEGIPSRPESFFVLQNASLNRSSVIVNINSNDENNNGRADKEESSKLYIYKRQISEQIDEWVGSLDIPLARNKEFRKYLVNDLTGDIVDRYKYLELNKDCVYKTDELEHLKYQIFKWINKIVGDTNNEAVNHAAELLERIRVIKKPGTTSSREQDIQLNKDTTTGSSQKTSGNKAVNADDDDDGNVNFLRSVNVIPSNASTYLGHGKDPDQNTQMPADKTIQTHWYSYGERYNDEFADSYLTDGNLKSINCTSQYIPTVTNKINTSTQTFFPVLIDQEFQTKEQVPPASVAPTSDPKSDCCKPLTSSLKPPPPGPNTPATPSIKQLNDEFEEYLNNWVNEIPIETKNPEEVAVAEKARIGIRHGIWKAIASIKSQPSVYFNRFYYEDVLGDAIDELLDILPQTPELKDKRYMLRAKLLERAMDITDEIKTIYTPASYKQQLEEQVAANLQRRTVKTEDDDPKQLYEEMHIQCIVEDFILSSCYKNEDKLKETAYRNKLKKKVESLVNEAKKTHGKDFRDLNNDVLCFQDIIAALCKVPAPSDATLKDEADEIILGHEIDHWFDDLPIVKNDDPQEKYLRRRLKDALTIKLHELEKNINFADVYDEPEFKHEISLFLDKVPLEKDESLNINFMVGELANRIKNRDRPGRRRKSVAFEVADRDCCRMNLPEDNSEGQNNTHTNPPAESKLTRQPFDEADYNVFQKEKPANSTMINPALEPQRYNNEQLPDHKKRGIDSQQSGKWYSFDSAGNIKFSKEQPQNEFTFAPGQYQEKPLGGKFGDDAENPSAEMQQPSPPYARDGAPDSPDATQHGPPIRNYFDNSWNFIRSPEDQNQPNPAPPKTNRPPLFNMDSAMQAPDDSYANLEPPVPAENRSMDMPSYRQFTSDKPASSSWHEQPGDERHSLLYDGPPRPNQSQHRTYYDPYELPPEEVQGGRFALDGTRLSERPGRLAINRQTPYGVWQEQPEDEYHSIPLYDGPPLPNQSQRRAHFQPYELPLQERERNQDQSNPEHFNLPKSVQPPSSPGSHRINSGREDISQTSSDRARMSQAIEQNRSLTIGRDQNAFPQDELPIRTHVTMTEPIENPQPTSSQRPDDQDQRYLAQTPPQTGFSIDNQPVGSSTPNQRPTNDFPPNIKERRQVERDRHPRQDYGTDDDQQGRHRCPCLGRPVRCIRVPLETNSPNFEDRRPGNRDRPSERDYGTDDDEGARRRTGRCGTWFDYDDYIRARIPMVCPYGYVSHPYCSQRKRKPRWFSPRYPGSRVPKFPR